MGKRGNEHGQIRKEEADELYKRSSDAPKGPFQKASAEVMKKRRIVRTSGKFASAKKSSSTGGTFATINLTATPAVGGSGGSGNTKFGGFSFGASTPAPAATKPFSFSSSTPAPAPAATKPAFPAFATPGASTKPAVPKASGGSMSKNDEKLVQCAQGFLKHLQTLNKVDVACYQQFVNTFASLSKTVEATTQAVTKSKAAAGTSNWDSSRPLFGAKPLISPTGGSAPKPASTTNLFGAGASSPAPATVAFSFNPTKTSAAAAPVPAFSFSTSQSAAVKEAAKTAVAATSTKPESAGDDGNKEEEDNGELEAANDDYEVLYKTKTKILHVSKNAYIKGLLKLEKNKESGKNRLVVRDAVSGRVKMNSAISKGMPLSKGIVPATKKKGPTPVVMIKAAFDENSKEPEDFKIITTSEEHENLFNELQKLV